MICGHCKDDHGSVAEVRACYQGRAARPRAGGWLVKAGVDATRQRQQRAARPSASPTRPQAALVRWVNEGWLDTITPDTERCGRCAGTGQFITGSVNGVPTGPGGACYRCSGKGHQTDCGPARHRELAAAIDAGERDTGACCDRVRNDLYDTFGIRWAA